jgi:hypothetical protein
MGLCAGIRTGKDIYMRWTRCKKKAAKFSYHVNESNWETLSQCRKVSRTCAIFKAHSGERAWKAIIDRLQRPNYLRRLIMNGKSVTRGKGRISGNIPL